MPKRGQPSDDVWSAPESGTVRENPDETAVRGTPDPIRRFGDRPRKDEPSVAGEEK